MQMRSAKHYANLTRMNGLDALETTVTSASRALRVSAIPPPKHTYTIYCVTRNKNSMINTLNAYVRETAQNTHTQRTD